MLAFMAILVLGAALFPLSRTYTQSLLTRALVGLGAAAVWVPSLRLISGARRAGSSTRLASSAA